MQSDLDSDTLDTLYKRLVKHVKKETVIIPGVAEIKTKKGKPKTAQEKIDEFWVKFNSKAPGKATSILPKDSYAEKVSKRVPRGTSIVNGQNAVTSYEEVVKTCQLKVEKIIKECRRANQKYRDPHFDLEFDLKWNNRRDCLDTLTIPNDKKIVYKPLSVKRVGDIFENPKFFIDRPTPNAVRQGDLGDCWLMAALCAIGNKPDLIERICVARDEAVGVYGFVFFRDFEWISEIVDDKLYLKKADYDESKIERALWDDRERKATEEDYKKTFQTNSGALYFAQCEDPNETWLPLLEKAFAKACGDYASLRGGWIGEGVEDLTGGVTNEFFSTDILDKEDFWKNELLRVNQDFLFGCSTGMFGGSQGHRKHIIECHAYSIMRAVDMDGERLLLLKNPWGKTGWIGAWGDGSKEWTPEWMEKLNYRFGDDGNFWISYNDLLKHFQTIERTRLFDEEWKVAHEWTSLRIPWSADYHDTKFVFTISEPTCVVVALSQLDHKYFVGLGGEYEFQLSFRIHKEGSEDYIVRSHGNYWRSRSVSTELDLEEAGEYHVLIKIEASRSHRTATVEQVIRTNCKDRKEKLRRVGLSYDLAHAKAQVDETVEEKKEREKAEARAKAKERKEWKEKLMEEKRKEKRTLAKQIRKEKIRKAKEDAKATARARKQDNKAKAEPQPESDDDAGDEEEAGDEAKPDAEKEETDKVEAKEEAEAEAENPEEDKPIDTPTSSMASTPAAIEPDDLHSETQTFQSASTETIGSESNKLPSPPGPTTSSSSEPTIAPSSSPPPTALLATPVSAASLPTSPPKSKSPTREIVSSSDSDSDTELSDASNISTTEVEEIIAQHKKERAEETAAKAAAEEEKKKKESVKSDSEDEFEKDPWNAVAVVGLRVYAKLGKNLKKTKVEDGGVGQVQREKKDEKDDGQVTVRVVRPKIWQDGETALDVDDPAADATKVKGEEGIMGMAGSLAAATV